MNQQPEVINALIPRCLNGDQTAFAALYELCAPIIYRLCYGLLVNRQDAEDITQEAFVYAFKNLKRYDSTRASFKTWLYTIALSRCRNLYRRKRLPWMDFASLLSADLPAPKSEAPESKLAQRDVKAMVENALSELTPRLREAVVLRYGHGLTYREMAEVIGCPQKTAESRVRLAHERLRGTLQPTGESLLEELIGIEV
ncbi:MAG: RNA polymerase sigma factor [Anaerolineae bacterium]|nr:RNA polymerase sigma factor [Anaerolineae bacterium]